MTNNKKQITIACNDEISAAKIYDVLAEYYYKEYAYLNFPKNKIEQNIKEKIIFCIKNNMKIKLNNFTSNYMGIYYDKKRQKWCAIINKKNLGRFNSEKEAVEEYNKEAIKLNKKINIIISE